MAIGFQYLIEVDVDHALLAAAILPSVESISTPLLNIEQNKNSNNNNNNNNNNNSNFEDTKQHWAELNSIDTTNRQGLGVIYALSRQAFSCYLFFFGSKMKKQVTPTPRQSLKPPASSRSGKLNSAVK
ncbi:unnamed protein product, partial [Trichobilharzia regenti]